MKQGQVPPHHVPTSPGEQHIVRSQFLSSLSGSTQQQWSRGWCAPPGGLVMWPVHPGQPRHCRRVRRLWSAQTQGQELRLGVPGDRGQSSQMHTLTSHRPNGLHRCDMQSPPNRDPWIEATAPGPRKGGPGGLRRRVRRAGGLRACQEEPQRPRSTCTLGRRPLLGISPCFKR